MSVPASSGVTFFQTLRRLPSPSIKNVDLNMPMNFLPYIFLSPQAPYASATTCSVSASKSKGKSFSFRNALCFSVVSGETPITVAPAA